VRVVSADDLGAWLLKASGDHTDIAERAARRVQPGHWCVRPGYRTGLMRPGHRLVFWVSGSRRRLVPGIWALGQLTGPPMPDSVPDRLRVPLALRWLDEDRRVARDALRADERLTGLEVLRQPQAANPSFVTVRQLRAIDEHLRRCAESP
jgi:hypothetical protein